MVNTLVGFLSIFFQGVHTQLLEFWLRAQDNRCYSLKESWRTHCKTCKRWKKAQRADSAPHRPPGVINVKDAEAERRVDVRGKFQGEVTWTPWGPHSSANRKPLFLLQGSGRLFLVSEEIFSSGIIPSLDMFLGGTSQNCLHGSVS